MSDIPKEILLVGFDFDWDNERLWKLSVPTESLSVSELNWHFAVPFWSTSSSHYGLRPADVIADPSKHPEHYLRSMKSDLAYPIDIAHHKGRWVILDGLHRLVKATLMGQETVLVRKISQDLLSQIVVC